MLDTTTASTAADAYKMHDANITELLARFIDKKREHAAQASKQPLNWGYVADIAETERRLQAAIEMIDVRWSGT